MLLRHGLTDLDAKIYVFVAKKGLVKALDILKAMKINKEQIYRSLKKLQSKGLVTATLEHPARFSAVPMEKVLDMLIRAKMEEAQEIRQNKEEILSIWNSMNVAEANTDSRFSVLEGRNMIYSKIQQMMQETKSGFSVIADVKTLGLVDWLGLFENAALRTSNSEINFQFLTELTAQNVNAMRAFLGKKPQRALVFRARNPDLGLSLFPKLVLRDGEELLLFIAPTSRRAGQRDEDTCLWTNSKSIVQAFAAIFNDLWENASEIENMIADLEAEEYGPITKSFQSGERAKNKYLEMLRTARNEIIVITSSKGLTNLSKHKNLIDSAVKRGVLVRVMAPIGDENLEEAKQVAANCQVRHISDSDYNMTVVDCRHLFRFGNKSRSDEEEIQYTANPEYVDKMVRLLEEAWKNAAPPSFVEWEIGFGVPEALKKPLYSSYYSDTKMAGSQRNGLLQTQERDSIKRTLDSMALKSWKKEATVAYCTMGQAIIQLPSELNTPTMGIRVTSFKKESGFGEGKNLIVHLWLETPPGFSMVPVAVLTDSPKEALIDEKLLAGTPAANNIVISQPNQFEVLVKDNLLFAGWSANIELPSGKKLRSGSLVFEGRGEGKRLTRDFVSPVGFSVKMEFTRFPAMTTFMSQTSQYLGSSARGTLATDCVFKTTPP